MDINILLHKFSKDSSNYGFVEAIPDFIGNSERFNLTIDSSGNINWHPYNFNNLPNSPKDKGQYNLNIDEFGNIDWITPNKQAFYVKDSPNISVQSESPDNEQFLFKFNIDSLLSPNENFIGTDIYYKENKYILGSKEINIESKFSIYTRNDYLNTGLHIGTGKFGFSFGNGTSQGFVPQIIGMGSDDNDPGLYFIGKSLDDISSNIPVVVIDGRNQNNDPIENRPIFGITNNGINSDFKFLVDQYGKVGIGKSPEKYKLEVNGTIETKDLIIDNYSIKELIEVIKNQQEQIDELKEILNKLQKQ